MSSLLKEELREIPIGFIRNFDSNRVFNTGNSEWDSFVESIRDHGLSSPVLVTEIEPDVYDLEAGHRRTRAHVVLGKKFIKAIVKPRPDSMRTYEQDRYVGNIIENLHRTQQTPFEQGRQYNELKEKFGLTEGEIAVQVNKSKSYVVSCIKNFQGLGKVLEQTNAKTASGKGASRGKGLPNTILTTLNNTKQGYRLSNDQMAPLVTWAKESNVQSIMIKKAGQLIAAGYTPKEAIAKSKSAGKVEYFPILLTQKEFVTLTNQSKNYKKYIANLVRSHLKNIQADEGEDSYGTQKKLF